MEAEGGEGKAYESPNRQRKKINRPPWKVSPGGEASPRKHHFRHRPRAGRSPRAPRIPSRLSSISVPFPKPKPWVVRGGERRECVCESQRSWCLKSGLRVTIKHFMTKARPLRPSSRGRGGTRSRDAGPERDDEHDCPRTSTRRSLGLERRSQGGGAATWAPTKSPLACVSPRPPARSSQVVEELGLELARHQARLFLGRNQVTVLRELVQGPASDAACG